MGLHAETDGASVSGDLYELNLEHLGRERAARAGHRVVELAGGERRAGNLLGGA